MELSVLYEKLPVKISIKLYISVSEDYLFLAHLTHWLMVSYCECWMSVVHRQQMLRRTSPPKLLAGF